MPKASESCKEIFFVQRNVQVHVDFKWRWTIAGVANGTSKNVGLGKFCQDLEISEAFMISLEVSFFDGLFLLFWVSKLFTKESRARISN